MKKLLLVLLCLALAFALIGCDMLKGEIGPAGEKGETGPAGEKGEKGDTGATGADGKSSYQIAVEHGFTGTEDEWLASLKGDKGDTGVGIKSISIDRDGYVYVTLTNGESFTIQVDDYCYHENSTEVITSPTCIDRGYTTKTCNDCGFVITNTYVEQIGHHFVDKKCNICGEDEKFGYITLDTEWYNTTDKQFTITTREQLAGLSYLVSEGNNFSGKTITLGNNIDLGGDEWIPIGNSTTKFAGTFDGHEYTVYNLKLSEQSDYVGLFGYITGTVKRLSVSAASVTASEAGSYVAIVCGYSSGTLDQVSASGFVTAPDSNYVGGVCGKLNFTGNKTITNLSSNVTVVGREYTGGLFGHLCGCFSSDSDYTFNFSSSENTGSISGTNYVGGVCGKLCVDNSDYNNVIKIAATEIINSGNVTGTSYVGGLFGYASSDTASKVTNSASSAKIAADYYVGGIAGYLASVALNECDNDGSSVTGNSYFTSNNVYYAYVGGYVGYGYKIDGCVNSSNITYTSKGDYVGGIAGYLTGSVTNSQNNGNITAVDSNYVGGIAGMFKFSGSNTVTGCVNTGKISANDYVGGLFGKLCGCFSTDSDCTFNFNLSENGGEISATNYVGGLAGQLCIDNSDYNNVIKLLSSDIKNTGNVSGISYVGGFFGTASSDTSSKISDSVSSASIAGNYYVGGLAGKLTNISLVSCSNANSTVTANDYLTSNNNYYAYLGGYVGYGYELVECVNASDIVYSSKGDYVGGLAGYLTYGISSCENSGKITAPDSNYVGGLAGMISFSGGKTITACVNSGDVSANNNVGGIFGRLCDCYDIDGNHTLYLTLSSNSGNVSGSTNVGGFIGYLCMDNSNYDNVVYLKASDITNTGDVNGTEYVGGFIGLGSSDGASSIKNAASSANIVANYYVGGLAGKLTKISLIDCSNANSTVTANDYLTSDGKYYVYLGGYVGYGYEVRNSVNESDITYTSKGDYVGGIAGYLKYRVDTCSNTADITAENVNYVGGLAGKIEFSGNNSITNCHNSGKVVANDYVGGLFGHLCGCYDIDSDHTLTMSLSGNSGEVNGNNYVGGIAGKLCISNSNYSNNIKITATDVYNQGNITGVNYVGGLFAYATADKAGTISDYTCTGTVVGEENYNNVIAYASNVSF